MQPMKELNSPQTTPYSDSHSSVQSLSFTLNHIDLNTLWILISQKRIENQFLEGTDAVETVQ